MRAPREVMKDGEIAVGWRWRNDHPWMHPSEWSQILGVNRKRYVVRVRGLGDGAALQVCDSIRLTGDAAYKLACGYQALGLMVSIAVVQPSKRLAVIE